VWTQTSSYQVVAARFAERFEAEVLRYPKLRLHHMENDIKRGLAREKKLEQEILDLKLKLRQSREANQEIIQVNKQLEATANSITDTIIPQHEKIIALK